MRNNGLSSTPIAGLPSEFFFPFGLILEIVVTQEFYQPRAVYRIRPWSRLATGTIHDESSIITLGRPKKFAGHLTSFLHRTNQVLVF